MTTSPRRHAGALPGAGVPGAAGQPHHTITEAGHFLQEDGGEELADRLVRFVRETGG